MGFLDGASGKESACKCRRHIGGEGSVLGLGRSPGRRNCNGGGGGGASCCPEWRLGSGGGCRSLRQEATVCPPEAADDLQGDLFHLSSTAITAEQLFFTCECRLCACGVCVHTQVHTHTLFLGPPFSLSIPSLSLQPHKQQAPKRSQPLQGRQPCLTVQRVEAALSLRGPGPTVGSPCQLPASPCPAGRARTCTV